MNLIELKQKTTYEESELFMILEFIRTNYGYDIWVSPDSLYDKKIYQYNIENLDTSSSPVYYIGEYETPYLAYVDAIKFILNNLL
jgi:hypothetical protein